MINDLTVGITTVSFSKDDELLANVKSRGFKSVVPNPFGKRLSQHQLIEFLSNCDVAIVGLDEINSDILQHLPKLKAVAKYGVGLDNIDQKDCEDYKVSILHTQGVNKRSVAEMTLGFMIDLCRNLYITSNLLKNGTWHKAGGIQLTGKTVGIIGVGHIGKEVIKLLKPFECNILVNDIIDQSDFYETAGVIEAEKSEIFQKSDIITVHTSLNASTHRLFNADTFNQMKSTAYLVNTARGGIVDPEALKTALVEGQILGAAIDVYDVEPPENKGLIHLPNLITTPHIGGNAQEAIKAMGETAVDNIINWAEKRSCIRDVE